MHDRSLAASSPNPNQPTHPTQPVDQKTNPKRSSTLDRALRRGGPAEAAWVDRMQRDHRLFVVPKGSNDDWYFLFAAFVARVSRGGGRPAVCLSRAGGRV
jgi:hypothetical protein